MKLKVIILLLGIVNIGYSNTGKELFDINCASCHEVGARKIAPPTFAVINHLKQKYTSEDEFVNKVVNWVNNPNKNNTVMPGAIKKFGLMPKIDILEQDLLKIANFLYNHNPKKPKWYEKHYREEHGHNPK